MGDEQKRHLVFFAYVHQDLKNLCAYRDIEHRDGFVSNDELRFHGKCSSNYDPLALPAG